MEHPVYQSKLRVTAKATDQLDAFVRQMKESASPSVSGIMVAGQSGTGKTFLVENYLQGVEATHPVLIARHYQQHQNIPYFGFKYCISDYLSKIYNQISKTELHTFSGQLREYLGEGFLLLVDYIPELALVFGKQDTPSARSNLTIGNQLYPLFRRLFEFLAHYYQRPVFLFTDDLQWMDASGINLLKYLLLRLPARQLIWIGASRSPQNKTSLPGQLIEELRLREVRVGTISLKGFDREEFGAFIEMVLGAPCHASLSDICYALTEGKPSHLQALMESLTTTGLIWREGNVFHGNTEAIKIQYEGQQAQRVVWKRMERLSRPASDVLCIMACLGRFNRQIILDWLQGNTLRLSELIDEAVEAGLLESYEQEVRFSEMNLAEMIYNELSESRKLELHYKIANLFYARGLERLNGTDIILMTTSFNQALEQVKTDGRLQLIADLNYRAGKILQNDKAYDQARYFLKMSAEMLKECRWEDVREQMWLVYMDRARTEYYLGEYDLAEIHLDSLLERVTDPLKRAKAFELKITINNHLARYQKVVWILRESLGELGLELPMREEHLQEEVKRLKDILAAQETHPGPHEPENSIRPEYSEAILRLLYVGGMSLHHTSDVLMTWAALQIILSANRENPSAVKAIGYVSYGRMLIISGDIAKGYEYGTKGLEINKALDDITLRCRVFGVFAFYIQPWTKAFSESNTLLKEAAEAGRKAGDLIGIYILKTHQLNIHLISGLPLKGLAQWDFDESYPGMELTYYITHYQKSLIRFLTGESPVFLIPRQNPSSLAGQLTIREEKFYRHYVWARYYFLFGHYELAARAAREANENRKLQEASPLVPANLMTWYLAITQNWHSNEEECREQLMLKVRELLAAFEHWKTYASANYRSGWLLMMAEYHRINGEDEVALRYFRESFDHAEANIYHRALTSELWARFLLGQQPRDPEGLHLLRTAIAAYQEWDGVAKARQLDRKSVV